MSYQNILRAEDANLYMGRFKGTDHKLLNAFKAWNYNFFAAPKKGVNLAHWWCQEAPGNVRSSSVVKVAHDGHKVDLTAKNELYQVMYTSPMMESADWQANATAMWQDKFGKEQWYEGGINLASPDMSGVKANFVFQFSNKAYPDKDLPKPKTAKESDPVPTETTNPDTRLKLDAGFVYEKDLAFAVKFEHQLVQHPGLSASGVIKRDAALAAKNEEAKAQATKDKVDFKPAEHPMDDEIEMTVAYRMDKNRVWAGYDVTNNFFKLGGSYKVNSELNLMKEVRVHPGDKKRTCLGQELPIESTVACKYLASKDSELTAAVEFGNNVHAQMRADHKYDNKLKLAMIQSYNTGAKQAYNVGFDFTYNL